MAGSLRTFVYTSDSGEEFVVRLDESTYEDTELGFKSTAAAASPPVIVNGTPIKMRYVNCYRQEDGTTVRRRFWVGDPTMVIYRDGGKFTPTSTTSTGDAVEGGAAWFVSSSVGEKRKRIGLADTGQTEGDQDGVNQNLAVP